MLALDMNYWGLVVVPLGVAMCFGPAVLVWFFAELRTPPGPPSARPERDLAPAGDQEVSSTPGSGTTPPSKGSPK